MRPQLEAQLSGVHASWAPLFETRWRDLEAAHEAAMEHAIKDPGFQLVFPPTEDWFRAFRMDVRDIRVVLLGQDPYHAPGQAMGLAFSVPRGVDCPPSLANMFREIRESHPDAGYRFEHGDLSRWEASGIFLLNSALVVKRGMPGSFLEVWGGFTDAAIRFVADTNPRAVFLLLGAFAKKKAALVRDESRVVTAAHPSPLSAYRGFFGSGVFRRVEEILGEPVDWQN